MVRTICTCENRDHKDEILIVKDKYFTPRAASTARERNRRRRPALRQTDDRSRAGGEKLGQETAEWEAWAQDHS